MGAHNDKRLHDRLGHEAFLMQLLARPVAGKARGSQERYRSLLVGDVGDVLPLFLGKELV